MPGAFVAWGFFCLGLLSLRAFVAWGFCRLGLLSPGAFVVWGFCRLGLLSSGVFVTGPFVAGAFVVGAFVAAPVRRLFKKRICIHMEHLGNYSTPGIENASKLIWDFRMERLPLPVYMLQRICGTRYYPESLTRSDNPGNPYKWISSKSNV